MKLLIILLLLLIAAALIYRRLRPHIRLARRVFATVNELRRAQSDAARIAAGAAPASGVAGRRAPEQLARCAACGTWFPASRGVRAGSASSASFCSAVCSERRSAAGVARAHEA